MSKEGSSQIRGKEEREMGESERFSHTSPNNNNVKVRARHMMRGRAGQEKIGNVLGNTLGYGNVMRRYGYRRKIFGGPGDGGIISGLKLCLFFSFLLSYIFPSLFSQTFSYASRTKIAWCT